MIQVNNIPDKREEFCINISDVISIVDRLTRLLLEENECLKARRYDAIDALKDEKTALTHILEKHYADIRENPLLIKQLSAEEKAALKTVNQSFQSVLDENGKLLNKCIKVNKRVIDIVTNVLSDHVPQIHMYQSDGTLSQGNNRGNEVVTSISYCESI